MIIALYTKYLYILFLKLYFFNIYRERDCNVKLNRNKLYVNFMYIVIYF